MTTKVKHIANNIVTDSQIDLSTIDSGEIAEGSNLYFTDARVDSRLSGGSVGAITHTQGYTQTAGTWQKQGTNGNITIASNGNEVNFSRNAANYLNATGASASLVLMTNNQTALTLNSGQNAIFAGDVTINGQLSITGNIDQYNVTDLDVTDKTITLGSGQTEAQSGGSGIVIDGSGANLLWDESDNRWEFNKRLLTSSINLSPETTQYAIDASLSLYSSSNAVYLNGAGANGWLRLNASGVNNDRCSINLFGLNQGDFMTFRTNSNTRMQIQSTGRVGIGHTSPNAQLHINAGTNSSVSIGDATNPALQIGGTTNYRFGVYTDGETAYIENKNGDDGLAFRVKTAGEAMRIDGGTGRVGIGTASPSYKFDVYGTDDVTMRIHRPSSGLAATDTCGIGFSHRGDTATSTSDTRAGIFSTYNGDLFLAVESGGNLNSNPMDHSALFIEGTNRYVGLGTTSPSDKLHILDGDLGIQNSSGRRYRLIAETNGGFTIRDQDASAGRLYIDTAGYNNFASGVRVGFTSGNQGSSAEKFTVYSASSGHSRFVNTHDNFSTVYIKNLSTTANTFQPYLTFQDGGGNRGNFGIEASTARLKVQGHGGIEFQADSGGLNGTSTHEMTTTGDFNFLKTDGVSIKAKESLVVVIDSDSNDTGRVFQVKGGNHSNGIHVANDTGTFSINAGDIATGSGDDTGYNYMQVVANGGYMPGGSSYAFRDYVFGFSGNNSHTLTWDNTDSYFNAEITFVAACTNGGSNNNVYARAFWTNNHTSHKFPVIEGMTQTSSNVGTVIVNAATGGIGAMANGDTFVFTASQGTQATNSGKLTLVHTYTGGSFYGGKVFMRVFFGSFQPQNFTVTT